MEQKPEKLWSLRRQGLTILSVVALLCIVTIISLAQAVTRDLKRLETANSDNVQWTLSQAEVEFQELHYLLDHQLLAGQGDLTSIRRAFDVFYSRIQTLATGSLYDPLRGNPDFTAPLAVVRDYLHRNAVLIDNIQSATKADLKSFEDETDDLRSTVRRISNSGLFHFAAQSDLQREAVSLSLKRLALVTTSLIVALGLLAYYSNRIGKQILRGRKDLQSAHARLHSIVTASLDGVIVVDRSGMILEFNGAAEKIFGHDKDDVIGHSLSTVIIPEHLRAAHEAGMKRMRENGPLKVVGQGRVVLEAIRKSGEVFPVELAVEAAGQGDGEIFIGFIRDISRQVAAEKELVEARDRALAGEKAKSDFLAVMTHEIRTPLNGVLGNLSLLEETRLSEKQKRYTRNMMISAEVLMNHVDTVLDIARVESGTIKPRKEPAHLGQLLQNIVDAQSSHAKSTGNKLISRWIGEPTDWVITDGPRLQQVLLNLVGNAIKFTDQGQITVEAERLYRNSRSRTVEIEFRVIDTGIGISKEDLAHIFDDFHTVDSSFKRNTEGTGLGLGIVRRLVEAMGGTAGVDSELGEGSIFWIRMPFSETSAPETAELDAPADHEQPALDILVVEDNEINYEIIKEILERDGHQVTVATDGLAGVNAAKAKRFDIILMDISMPAMDGLEASQLIRNGDGLSKDTTIIALSANVLPDIQRLISQAGMDGFLGKPIQRPELNAILATIDPPDHPPAPAEKPVQPPVSDADTDILSQLQDQFNAQVSELMTWLAEAPKDTGEIAKRSHKVAGSAAVFNQLELRDALISIENAAKNPDQHASLPDLIDAARALWASDNAATDTVQTAEKSQV